MWRVWGPVTAILVSLCPAAAQNPISYSSCKYGYELTLPAAMSRVASSEDGFEASLPDEGKIRVTAAADFGRASVWYENGRLIRKYHLESAHGRVHFVGEWERVDGLLVLEWVGSDKRPLFGHMAHAQPAHPAEVRYAVLRQGRGVRDWVVYEFTLTGAAAAMPFAPDGILRKVLDGFQFLPLDPAACSQRIMAQTAPVLKH